MKSVAIAAMPGKKRTTVAAGVVALALALGMSLAGAGPAEAVCVWTGTKGSTWTGSNPNGCSSSSYGQARVWRYIGTSPSAYDSPIKNNSYAYVSNSNGSDAGHAHRAGTSCGIGGTCMDGWSSF
ncbi:hypothetical protein GCM10009717_19810 [Agromyces allii]|uniref:Lactococcin 972 family bacteriocin n=1 Tax=Agromyces allii TaxID=393607 RepID=A0ABN2QKZ9_9MICO